MAYWIDTDPGLDDALAILLAVREMGEGLIGLSSVHGNGEEPAMAHNLLRVLARYQQLDLTPAGWAPSVARGARQPLAGGFPERGEGYHGEQFLGGLAWHAGAEWSARAGSEAAAVAIARAARQMPNLLQLVCIGPLTNLALRDLLRHFERRAPAGRGVPFYDPCAWLLTTHPELAHWESVYVAVDTGHGVGRGASLADWRGRSGHQPNVRAATHIADRGVLLERFFGLLGG